MKWFWQESRKSSPELEAIKELMEQNHLLADQYQGLAEQVTKLTRLQYKTSKDIQRKVDATHDSISSFVKAQEQANSEKELRILRLEAKLEELAHSLISWLDDLDLICSGLKENGQGEWNKILNQWSKQILAQLEGLGMVELHVIGTGFDPTRSESLGVVSKKEAVMKYKELTVQPDIPYQIVEVVKRGFKWKNGALLRKAEVITIEKENENDEF